MTKVVKLCNIMQFWEFFWGKCPGWLGNNVAYPIGICQDTVAK